MREQPSISEPPDVPGWGRMLAHDACQRPGFDFTWKAASCSPKCPHCYSGSPNVVFSGSCTLSVLCSKADGMWDYLVSRLRVHLCIWYSTKRFIPSQPNTNTSVSWLHFSPFYKKTIFRPMLTTGRYIQCVRTVWDHTVFTYGPGTSVGIATDYGLRGPGIESRWSEIFRTCPDRPWGPPRLLYNGYRVFPGGKLRSGRDADHSPPSSAGGHGRVELYLYPPSGPHRACNGVTLPLSVVT
jgi:hypothetical protein